MLDAGARGYPFFSCYSWVFPCLRALFELTNLPLNTPHSFWSYTRLQPWREYFYSWFLTWNIYYLPLCALFSFFKCKSKLKSTNWTRAALHKDKGCDIKIILSDYSVCLEKLHECILSFLVYSQLTKSVYRLLHYFLDTFRFCFREIFSFPWSDDVLWCRTGFIRRQMLFSHIGTFKEARGGNIGLKHTFEKQKQPRPFC